MHTSAAGIGSQRILLPSSVKKMVPSNPAMEFVTATNIGSFAKDSLQEIIAVANNANGMLLSGDFGRNSETALLLHELADKTTSHMTITKDAVDAFTQNPEDILNRENSAVIASLSQLHHIGVSRLSGVSLNTSQDMFSFVDSLGIVSQGVKATIVTKYGDSIFVGHNGQVSQTDYEPKLWQTIAASYVSVALIQHPESPFEAATTAIWKIAELERKKSITS